jgi:hypothetical protein
VEFGVAVIVKALREVTGRKIRLSRAAFAHSRNSNLHEFERFYVCPGEFYQAGHPASPAALARVLDLTANAFERWRYHNEQSADANVGEMQRAFNALVAPF